MASKLAFGVPDESPARRIGGISFDAGLPECLAVSDDVMSTALQQHRVPAGDAVQFLATRKALFDELAFVPACRAHHPLARRRRSGALLDSRKHVCNRPGV